jgi:hypothetical protein
MWSCSHLCVRSILSLLARRATTANESAQEPGCRSLALLILSFRLIDLNWGFLRQHVLSLLAGTRCHLRRSHRAQIGRLRVRGYALLILS